MRLQVDQRPEREYTVVTVSGEIDVFTAPRLRQYLIDLIAEGRTHLILDLTDVAFLDSTGLGVLVGTLKRVTSAGGSLSVAALNHRLLTLFHTTRLNQILPVYETVALAAGRPKAS